MTLSELFLFTATTQLEVEETPRNTNNGRKVKQYLKSVGLGAGYPWCMAFVYWCMEQAAKEMGQPNPLVKTGGVADQWNRTVLRKLPKTGAVKPGDIFIIIYKNGSGHTGIVEEVKNGYVLTVEGNTNDEGSREGYEVVRRERTLSEITGFIQI